MAKGKKLSDWLRLGGEAQLRRSASAEIYDVEGPDRKRSTGAGMTSFVGPMLDPRLKLTPRQRAIGQCYGAYAEDVAKAGGAQWVREFVDRQPTSGGINAAKMDRARMVDVARYALDSAASATYRIGKNVRAVTGRHLPIPARITVDLTCIWQRPVTFIAIQYGWTVVRSGAIVVPDRQRKAIGEALAFNLEIIGDAWHENDMLVPAQFGALDVE